MRRFIEKYGLPIGIVVLVIAALAYWLRSGGPPPRTNESSKAFFIDEETGAETVLSANEIPPLMGKDGKPTVVRVVKYSCDGGKTKKNLFFAKYPTDVQAALKSLPKNDAVADIKRSELMSREVYRKPEPGSPWVPSTSAEGQALMVLPDCNGKPAEVVHP